MNKHFNKQQLKNFAEGNYSLNNLFEISKHLSQCEICKENLLQVSPDFFAECAEQDENISAFTEQEHYSRDEILEFIKGGLSFSQKMKMSDHFRNCIVCKTKFYQADPEILKNYLLSQLEKEEPSKRGLFFHNFMVIAPIGTLATLLLAIMIYTITFSFRNDAEQKTIALSDLAASEFNQSAQTTDFVFNQIPKNTTEQKVADKKNKQVGQRVLNSSSRKTLPQTEKQTSLKFPLTTRSSPSLQIATTRNSKEKSSSQFEKFSVKIGSLEKLESDKRVNLSWKEISQTSKYQIFLTDAEQVVIEEGEVSNQANYTSKSTLQSGKSYKVIIVAVKENGERIISHPLYFTVNGLGSDKKDK